MIELFSDRVELSPCRLAFNLDRAGTRRGIHHRAILSPLSPLSRWLASTSSAIVAYALNDELPASRRTLQWLILWLVAGQSS